MRTLFEIINSAKDGNKPTHDECYWAMLALSAIHTFNGQDMLKIFELSEDDQRPFGPQFIAEENFQRNKRAFARSPQEYVGWGHDPANPEYQKFRKAALKIAAEVIDEDADKT